MEFVDLLNQITDNVHAIYQDSIHVQPHAVAHPNKVLVLDNDKKVSVLSQRFRKLFGVDAVKSVNVIDEKEIKEFLKLNPHKLQHVAIVSYDATMLGQLLEVLLQEANRMNVIYGRPFQNAIKLNLFLFLYTDLNEVNAVNEKLCNTMQEFGKVLPGTDQAECFSNCSVCIQPIWLAENIDVQLTSAADSIFYMHIKSQYEGSPLHIGTESCYMDAYKDEQNYPWIAYQIKESHFPELILLKSIMIQAQRRIRCDALDQLKENMSSIKENAKKAFFKMLSVDSETGWQRAFNDFQKYRIYKPVTYVPIKNTHTLEEPKNENPISKMIAFLFGKKVENVPQKKLDTSMYNTDDTFLRTQYISYVKSKISPKCFCQIVFDSFPFIDVSAPFKQYQGMIREVIDAIFDYEKNDEMLYELQSYYTEQSDKVFLDVYERICQSCKNFLQPIAYQVKNNWTPLHPYGGSGVSVSLLGEDFCYADEKRMYASVIKCLDKLKNDNNLQLIADIRVLENVPRLAPQHIPLTRNLGSSESIRTVNDDLYDSGNNVIIKRYMLQYKLGTNINQIGI